MFHHFEKKVSLITCYDAGNFDEEIGDFRVKMDINMYEIEARQIEIEHMNFGTLY